MSDQINETPIEETPETDSEMGSPTETTDLSVNAAALGETTVADDPTPDTVLDESPDETMSESAAALASAESDETLPDEAPADDAEAAQPESDAAETAPPVSETAEPEATTEAAPPVSEIAEPEATTEAAPPVSEIAEPEATTEATPPVSETAEPQAEATVDPAESPQADAVSEAEAEVASVEAPQGEVEAADAEIAPTGEAAAVTTPKSEAEAQAAIDAAGVTAAAEGRAPATVEVDESGEAVEEAADVEPEGTQRKRKRRNRPSRKPLDSFKSGDELQGKVRSIQPYGAFVDVGAERDGLVHISELRDGFVEKVEDVVKEGDEVTVRVKEVDTKRGRLSLTMRSEKSIEAEQERAQRIRLRDLAEGQEFLGRVNSVVDFGAFVDIGAVTDGLVHISELSEDRVNRVTDVVQEGEEVRVRVLSVDRKRNRISLTMREQVPQGDFSYEDEDDEEVPSMMELAFARAQERNNRKNKRKKSRDSRTDSNSAISDIIARTLEQHSEDE